MGAGWLEGGGLPIWLCSLGPQIGERSWQGLGRERLPLHACARRLMVDSPLATPAKLPAPLFEVASRYAPVAISLPTVKGFLAFFFNENLRHSFVPLPPPLCLSPSPPQTPTFWYGGVGGRGGTLDQLVVRNYKMPSLCLATTTKTVTGPCRTFRP